MAGQPRPGPGAGSPLDKLSSDVNQYHQAEVARKTRRRPVPPAGAREGASSRPALTDLDRNLGSQILSVLLMAGYALLMVAVSVGMFLADPLASPVLWPVMAVGVIVAMVAAHKGRPPLLWFMYGSILPTIPLLHALAARWLGSMLLGQGPSTLELLIYSLALGAIPLVHASLLAQDPDVREARQFAAGMVKCRYCAEMIKRDAKVCRHCSGRQGDTVT